jgi:hypothetical protein
VAVAACDRFGRRDKRAPMMMVSPYFGRRATYASAPFKTQKRAPPGVHGRMGKAAPSSLGISIGIDRRRRVDRAGKAFPFAERPARARARPG